MYVRKEAILSSMIEGTHLIIDDITNLWQKKTAMRIWSIHPQYLDAKGLVALWREGLLAKHVLEGKTVGYKNHPQLCRFKDTARSLEAINEYLSYVYLEAVHRGYAFNRDKLDWSFQPTQINVTDGQLRYETKHLIRKLSVRDPSRYKTHQAELQLKEHPMFKVVKGGVASWEILTKQE
jgi:hypothetical protein